MWDKSVLGRGPFLGGSNAVDVVLNTAHVDSPLDQDVALVTPSGAPRVTDCWVIQKK